MTTNLDCAYLSDDAYCFDDDRDFKNQYYTPKINAIKSAWIGLYVLDKHGLPYNANHAFFARLYANKFTGETVIAYRGTAQKRNGIIFATDIKDDVQLAFYRNNPQNQQALHFYQHAKFFLNQLYYSEKIPLLKVSVNINQLSRFPVLTGHSLGGYLAQYVAYKNPGTTCIAFNAPGIGGLHKISASNCHSSINNIVVDNDLIHKTGKQIGQVRVLKGKPYDYLTLSRESIAGYYYDQHKIKTEIDLMQHQTT
jgi:Protein of unknown function (DUF2974)